MTVVKSSFSFKGKKYIRDGWLLKVMKETGTPRSYYHCNKCNECNGYKGKEGYCVICEQ